MEPMTDNKENLATLISSNKKFLSAFIPPKLVYFFPQIHDLYVSYGILLMIDFESQCSILC